MVESHSKDTAKFVLSFLEQCPKGGDGSGKTPTLPTPLYPQILTVP